MIKKNKKIDKKKKIENKIENKVEDKMNKEKVKLNINGQEVELPINPEIFTNLLNNLNSMIPKNQLPNLIPQGINSLKGMKTSSRRIEDSFFNSIREDLNTYSFFGISGKDEKVLRAILALHSRLRRIEDRERRNNSVSVSNSSLNIPFPNSNPFLNIPFQSFSLPMNKINNRGKKGNVSLEIKIGKLVPKKEEDIKEKPKKVEKKLEKKVSKRTKKKVIKYEKNSIKKSKIPKLTKTKNKKSN